MSTLIMHPAGRELLHWSIPDTDIDDALEASFDNGHTWADLVYDAGEWTIYVQGPLATAEAGVPVLASGLHGVIIRSIGTQEIRVRDAGAIQVQADCALWPVDWSCWPADQVLDPDVRERAEELAISTLRMLTQYSVGNCPTTIEPHPVGHCGFTPHLTGGVWRNNDPCGSLMGKRILLPPPVGRIVTVTIDGVTLDPTAYRSDGTGIYRTDGGYWPSTGVKITYVRGDDVDLVGAYATGLLAAEYAKACGAGGTRANCSLPSGVTQVVRNGISIQITLDMFEDGLTTIRAVDHWTARYNPYRQRVGSAIYSPDLPW